LVYDGACDPREIVEDATMLPVCNTDHMDDEL